MNRRMALGTVLSFFTGAGIWYVIGFVTGTATNPAGPPLPFLLLNYSLIIVVAPALFGFFLPKRAWQWGIYIVVGQLVFGIATSPGDLTQLPLGIIVYMVLAIPAVLTGIAGAYLRKLIQKNR
jgi:hypothetical protein